MLVKTNQQNIQTRVEIDSQVAEMDMGFRRVWQNGMLRSVEFQEVLPDKLAYTVQVKSTSEIESRLSRVYENSSTEGQYHWNNFCNGSCRISTTLSPSFTYFIHIQIQFIAFWIM